MPSTKDPGSQEGERHRNSERAGTDECHPKGGHHLTPWMSLMLVVMHGGKQPRITLDPYHLNKATQHSHLRLPILSDIVAPLREPLKVTVDFVRLESHQDAFEELKGALHNTPTLEFFDLKKNKQSRPTAVIKKSTQFCHRTENQSISSVSRWDQQKIAMRWSRKDCRQSSQPLCDWNTSSSLTPTSL